MLFTLKRKMNIWESETDLNGSYFYAFNIMKGQMPMDLDHERRLTEVEQRSKSNTHRLLEVEKRQDNLEKLASSVEVLAVKETNVENDVKEIKNDVKSLAQKPAQRWEHVVTEVIKLLIVGVGGFLLAKVGL